MMKRMMERSGIRGRRVPAKVIFWVVGAVLVVAIAAAAVFFFMQYKNLKDNPDAAAQETTQRLVGEVGKLYALPGDETPTVALVQDKDKLKDQSFFAKAENGDYILIYTNSKLALLYREKDNKLINVGPVSISGQGDTAAGNNSDQSKP
jgi:hypothetical protein